jgi:NAD-dependent deacetylase
MGEAIDLTRALRERLAGLATGRDRLVVLTGAGISAESGIPTFRGKEGYWRVGSIQYQPEEMATHRMFERMPEVVWRWYLYRRGICRRALPNSGHHAVAGLERALGDRFLLVTQNVDGLHLRAGNTPDRTYQIHGNIDFARCDLACGQAIWPLPGDLTAKQRDAPLTAHERDLLHCPKCGYWSRPHVLWFDEEYDEETFRFHSSLRAADAAAVLLVVGTSGATNLPLQVAAAAVRRGALLIDVNPEPNSFSRMASAVSRGEILRGGAAQILPQILRAITGG